MWFEKHRIRLLLWLAILAIAASFIVKSEASLLFLIAFLAAFVAGILYSIHLFSRGYIHGMSNKSYLSSELDRERPL